MKSDRALLQQALNAIIDISDAANIGVYDELCNEITARLVEPEPEPVGWLEKSKNFANTWFFAYKCNPNAETKPLYTKPEHKPLTERQIKDLICEGVFLREIPEIVQAIEKAHGIQHENDTD